MITFIVVLDDMDREKKQKDLLVGSLNAANKYTIGRGKMQKLSGMIITKNIDIYSNPRFYTFLEYWDFNLIAYVRAESIKYR